MRRVAVLGLILAVAGSLAGSASPTHGKNVWSGQWTTSTGTLGLRWISDADGTKAIETFGGRPCPEPTDYFRGGYTTGAGDHGGVVGCTVNWRRLIARWNTNLASARDGTFDVSYSGDTNPATFSGRYQEDGGGSGPYTGRFKGHFGGDGALKGGPSVAGEGKTYTFSFRTYANNVRVVKPLVGAWQLGVARATGSGKFEAHDGQLVGNPGTVRIVSDPLLSRYPTRTMTAKVIGFSYSSTPHPAAELLSLKIQVTASSHPEIDCAPGTIGWVKLRDTDARLSNGKNGDYVTVGDWKSKCPSFVMGWTNADGGPRTAPQSGGPPDGGQWAIVSVSAPD